MLDDIDDILNQLELYRYSTHLKGVDLDQFMQMTDEKDFKLYGIRKQRDCHRLSQCAQSIRRTSLCSSPSSTTDELLDDDDLPQSPIMSPVNTALDDAFVSQISLPSMVSEEEKCNNSGSEEEQQQQAWPNSKIKRKSNTNKPPAYAEDRRRYSLPTLTPPEYCDYILDNRRRHSYADGIRPKDPGEGKEQLPKYSCTVQKFGQGKTKVEFESPGIRPRRRPWRDVHLELQGTMLKIFEMKPTSPTVGGYRYLTALAPYYSQTYKYTTLYNISLANVKVGVAVDYVKRPNVFRITTENGPQLLIQVQTNACVSSWIEKLSSGCNIAIDLEHQRMPKFNSLQIEPFSGWNSSTRLTYQEYVTEELLRRDTDSIDALI
jgi:hypothetical protein